MYLFSLFRINFIPIFVFCALLLSFLLCPQQALCAQVDLVWDKPTNTTNIVGYNIYCAPSGSSFSDQPPQVVKGSDQTTCTISDLTEGEMYGFVATSFDDHGNESDYSNKVYYTVPTSNVSKDSDGDGLSDADEDYYGTDPDDPDTDGDGLTDGEELEYWGDAWNDDGDNDNKVNLLDDDADGDGVCDATEILQGTNPADSSDNQSSLPRMAFGEVSVDHNWTLVDLKTTFQYPVVVAGPLSKHDSQPAVVRIRNVSNSSFEIRIQEYKSQDGYHSKEQVSFLVMEIGSYNLPDGSHIEAFYLNAQANYTLFDHVYFFSDFRYQPVVMTAITTFEGPRAVTGRVANISPQGFDYSLQEEEYSLESHPPEIVGYIAWEPSTGKLDGTQFAVALAHDITHKPQNIKFAQLFANSPSFLASMQTCHGGDTANLRYDRKTKRGLKINVSEENSLDDEINHTTESVGYIALHSVR